MKLQKNKTFSAKIRITPKRAEFMTRTLNGWFILVATALFGSVQAQSSNLLNAYDMMEQYRREIRLGNEEVAINALLKARGYMDEAIQHPSTSGLSKTWKYRGDVFYMIFREKSPRLVLDRAGADDSSAACYIRALTVEVGKNGKPKVESPGEVGNKLNELVNSRLSSANELMEAKKFPDAYKALYAAREWMKALAQSGLYDQKQVSSFMASVSAITYNMGLIALNDTKRDGYQELALQHFNEAIDGGYDSLNLYYFVAELQINMKKYDDARSIILKAKEKFPKESSLALLEIRMEQQLGNTDRVKALVREGVSKFPDASLDFQIVEANLYIEAGEYDKALVSINEAIDAADGDDGLKAQLFVTAGTLCDELSTKVTGDDQKKYMELAQDYYRKALEVNPKDHKALAGIGNSFIRRANDIFTRANDLPPNKIKEFETMKNEGLAELRQAAEWLEKSYAVTKTEVVRQNLIVIYGRLENFERLDQLNNDQIK